MKYFKLSTNSKVNALGITLFQLELTIDCKWGKAGDLGGWVESENTKSGDARVSGDAWVSGDAQVYGNAWVSGDAWVSGGAQVSGDARVYGNARVSGDAQVSGDAWEKSPLQIQGTRHYINVCAKFKLRIGCKEFSFSYWKREFKSIGANQNYTQEEINEYELYIDLAIKIYGLGED